MSVGRLLQQAAAGVGGFDPVAGEALFVLKNVSDPDINDATTFNEYRGSGEDPTTDFSFTVPDDVGEIHVVCVGAGNMGYNATGGNGGGLAYGTMTVVPGETLTVKVGMLGDGSASNRRNGGKSGVYRGSTKLISSDGTGSGVDNSESGGAGRTGSTYSNGYPGGGGGAAGYSGSGGTGTMRQTNAQYSYGTGGSGGGGGGGGARRRGGGVGVWGEGPSGAQPGTSNYGYAGSYGFEYGSFGGGGTGKDNYVTSPQTFPMSSSDLSYTAGRPGAVRIAWGNDRSFPTTSIDETDSYSIERFDLDNTGGVNQGNIPTLLAYTDGTSKTFTVPDITADQIYVSAVLVGGGGAGPYGSVDNVKYSGGGGGGLAHFANLEVSAGDTITYVVGRGGQGPNSYADTGFDGTAPDGEDTTLTYGTFVATAEGGLGGRAIGTAEGGSRSFSNTPAGVTTGGGDGGAGGLGGATSSQQNYGGGGGGAGGFDGAGGAGGKGLYFDGVSAGTDGSDGVGTQSGGGGAGNGGFRNGGAGGANTGTNQSKGGASNNTAKSSGGGGGAAYTLFNGNRSDRVLGEYAYAGVTATTVANYVGHSGGTPGGGAGSGGGGTSQITSGTNYSNGGDGAIAIYVHTTPMTLPV